MTKLTQPLGSTEARGKLGGLCYNTWRGISYVKTIKSPGNQNTPRRLAARALAKQCTSRWQTISDVQRSWWNDYSLTHLDPYWTGNPKRNSGYNWFMRANFRLLAIGLSILDTPPVRPNQWPIITLTVVPSGSTFNAAWTIPPSTPESDLTIDLWLTKPQSAGRQPKIEDAKHLTFTDCEEGYYDSGGLAPGTYGLFGRTIDELTGLSSPWTLTPFAIAVGSSGFEGPSFPTIGATIAPPINPWLDPNNICLLDAQIADSTIADQANTDHLFGSHFDFAIPTGKTISGILARACFLAIANSVITAQLRDATGLLGNPKALPHIGTDPEWLSWGSDSDVWGATLSPTIVNADGFGLDILCHNDAGAPHAFDIDVFELTASWTT